MTMFDVMLVSVCVAFALVLFVVASLLHSSDDNDGYNNEQGKKDADEQ